MDRSFWRAVVANQFAVPDGYTAAELLPDLLAGLGSTDSELRDKLCLEILWNWIPRGWYTPEELAELSGRLLANLQAGVGAGENDQLFLRTFSVLVLYLIVQHDANHRFLTDDRVHQILEGGLAYLAAEQDLRGWVPEKGWAHSVAHTADLLMGLAGHPAMAAAELERLLEAMVAKVISPTTYPFVDNEDGRLARAVLTLLQRELVPLSRVAAILQRVGGNEQRYNSFVWGEDNARYHNMRSFLMALHVILAHPDLPAGARSALEPVVYGGLRSFSRWL